MKEYLLDDKYLVFTKTDSKGTQPKYFKDNIWYKIDKMGREGLAEEMISKILSCSNLHNFVQYEECIINNKRGCLSKNFLKENESFVSFKKLYQNYVGGSLSDRIYSIYDIKDRFTFLTDFMESATGVDCTGYLRDILSVDLLTKNPDRHFHNIGIIYNRDTKLYREAPIFDNGQGFFQNYSITPPHFSYEKSSESVFSATISGNFEAQVLASGNRLKIDYKRAKELLMEYPDSRIKDTAFRQLEKYKSLFKKEELVKFTDVIDSEYDFNTHISDDDYIK